MGGALAGSG